MIVWTHAVVGVLHVCVLYFCICTCSHFIIIIIIIITSIIIIINVRSQRRMASLVFPSKKIYLQLQKTTKLGAFASLPIISQ